MVEKHFYFVGEKINPALTIITKMLLTELVLVAQGFKKCIWTAALMDVPVHA